MDFAIVNFDEIEDFEKPFLVLPKRVKIFGGLRIGILVVKIKKLLRPCCPGCAPVVHLPGQKLCRVVFGSLFPIQFPGQHNGRARQKIWSNLGNIP